MDGSPGDVSEEPLTSEKRNKGWRMRCDVGEAKEGVENDFDVGEVTERVEDEHSSVL